jgi:hypothetical protein
MIPNAFIGRPVAPTDGDLESALGMSKSVWDGVVVDMARATLQLQRPAELAAVGLPLHVHPVF